VLLWLLALVVSIPLGLDLYMPVPEENPLTREKIELGRKLFHDRRLSRDRTIACASCHDPDRAFTDGRPVAIGISRRLGRRSAPTLVNRGYGRAFFWDGRAATLEEQVLQPIQDPNEMDMTLPEVSARVGLPSEEIARALASYVRSILSASSRFDRYVNGDRRALSSEQRAGLQVFRGNGNCTACHVGPTFTDEQFHNTGVAWREIPGEGPGSVRDEGRFAVTRNPEDRGAFKTPTLREIARTAPYMHDGSFLTLEEVVDYYDRGGNRNPGLDRELRPLRLAPEDKRVLVEFLKALDGRIQEGV
jgi:cytochrome c peroxidase